MTAKTSISTKLIALALLSLVLSPPVNAQDAAKRQRGWDYQQVSRWLNEQARSGSTGVLDDECPDFATRRDVIMNGNRITSQIQNFGSISSPGNTITDIVWNGLGYGYEFGPFVAAEIVDVGRQDPKSVQLLDDEGNAVLDDNGEPGLRDAHRFGWPDVERRRDVAGRSQLVGMAAHTLRTAGRQF